MSNVVLGLGTLLQLSDGASSPSTVFTSVAEIANLAISNYARDSVEVTHHESTAPGREYIAGLLGAELQLTLNFLPNNATQRDLTTNVNQTTAASIFRTYRIVWPDFGASSFTGTVNTGTDVWTTATHSWLTGQPVRFSSSVALPASTPQIVAGTTYYLGVTGTTTFKVYATSANAAAGSSAIDFTGTGTGTHTVSGGSSWTFSAHCSGFDASAMVSKQLTATPKFKVTATISILP